jgi:signal transduction histidine kinase
VKIPLDRWKWGWCLLGGAAGYFVFHPFVMISSRLMSESINDNNIIRAIGSEVFRSFSLEMVPWSFAFTLLGASIGFFYGKIREAEKSLRNAHKELEKRVEERTLELRKANDELRKAKKAADAASQFKSELMANISHEIRTPMNGVIAAVELALKEVLPPKTTHYITVIQSSAYSLLGIINDILDFTKIETDNLSLKRHSFQLDEVLENLRQAFAKKAEEKQIELLFDIEPETPLALIGDPLRLEQILTKLVDNAVKFTEKNGVIHISVKVSERSAKRIILTFSVKDNGIGISPEQLKKIFNPFVQADSSSTRKFGGTGLGLYICSQLIKRMNGKIDAESVLGKGSTFTFSLRFDRQLSERNAQPKFLFPAANKVSRQNKSLISKSEASVNSIKASTEKYPNHQLKASDLSQFDQLAEALELADPEKIQKNIKAIQSHLSDSTFKDLEKQIMNYDYESAIKIVQEIIMTNR